MVQIQGGFNTNNVEAPAYGPVPAGEYLAIITETDFKPNSKGTGHFISARFDLLEEGDSKGRVVYGNYNIDNPNPTAVQIAQQDLSAICQAVGYNGEFTDTKVLENTPLIIKVGIDKNDPDRNVIKGYKPNGASVAQAATAPVQQDATAQTQPAQTQTQSHTPQAGGTPWAQNPSQ